MDRPKVVVVACFLTALASLATSAFASDRVSGVISSTYMLVEDTDLIGDVTCDVTNGACFSFAAPDIELRLNGFTITGKADPTTGCGGALSASEFGVTTNARNNVVVRGPGLMQRFRNHAVNVAGSTNVRVESLTVSTNCGSGIFVAATAFSTLVHDVTAVRNGASTPGLACGGIWIAGHNSRVRLNAAQGNGYSEPADDFGIGVIGTGSDNVIEQNTVSGNTNGILIGAGARNTLVRENRAVGNPAIQVGHARPDVQAVDILNLAPAGQTTFERNMCVTSVNAPCPNNGRQP